jgi:hypothetical protein
LHFLNLKNNIIFPILTASLDPCLLKSVDLRQNEEQLKQLSSQMKQNYNKLATTLENQDKMQ